jgi:Tfp pilus assembly protein PilW
MTSKKGLTFVELLIAISLSAVVFTGILRIYSSSVNSYNLQEQLSEMHQNAKFTINCLSEELMQAGASLPDTGFDIINAVSGKTDSFSLYVNRKGATWTFSCDTQYVKKIAIPDAQLFVGSDTIIKLGIKKDVSIYQVAAINTSADPDTIQFTSAYNFYRTETIYALNCISYFLSGTNFCRDTPSYILSENIDSLSVTFYQKNGNISNSWSTMAYARILVRARTANAVEKKQSGSDGYKRLTLTLDVRFRNRF